LKLSNSSRSNLEMSISGWASLASKQRFKVGCFSSSALKPR
jgi:hypothetical protein